MSGQGPGGIRAVPAFVQQPHNAAGRVNLFPLVNLFLTLIPFLLLCVGFAPLAAAQLDLPTQPPAPHPGPGPKVALTLLIRPNVFQIEAQSSSLSALQLRRLGTRVPRTMEDHEATDRSYAQLSQALSQIKQRYPSSDSLSLIPDDSIPYEDVIATMDVVRERTLTRGGGRMREALFPVVILGTEHR